MRRRIPKTQERLSLIDVVTIGRSVRGGTPIEFFDISTVSGGAVRLRVHSRFTLIELLVVVAIIGILASLLLPALARVNLMGKKTQCANNLRQFGISHLTYADDHDDWFGTANHTSACQYWLDAANKKVFDGYYNVAAMVCPDTRYLHSDLPQYGPGYRWAGHGINSTYRIYAARGSYPYDVSYFFWGFYALGGKPTTSTSPYCVATPCLKFTGRFSRSLDNDGLPIGPTLYIHEPAEQPMAMDARHETNEKYIIYASSRFCANNHALLNGINVVFLDGHQIWAPQTGNSLRMYVGYWDGYMRW